MSFIILLLLLLFVGFTRLLQWRKTSLFLSLVLISSFVLIGSGLIPRYLLNDLQTDYESKPDIQWSGNNAIVLLGAGTQLIKSTQEFEPAFFSFGRINEAASQYKDCAKTQTTCTVIISGGDAQNNGVTEAEVYQQQLLRLGVPIRDIIQEPNSVNTWKNAQLTSDLMKHHKFDNIVLVSSGLHIRRSELYFNHFGLNVIPVRADYMAAQVSWLPLWYNFAVTDFALHEQIGFARYNIYNFMGWNSKREQPGDA
ncbi:MULTISPECIES: YdcF family protein [Vibrio]|uniref:YdcF family protein n=1 Tax=Vibrio splendidus TaxID=29497 RepID=A0A7Y4CUA1_VIBSP|nr:MULTISPECIES: YdcF family protein [Vibrio]MCF7494960.1 YdcF family protein [Vibrio sp. L5-1]NOI89834.1 YdcF family protein [Vibrio splendidus]NOJ05171.1 YdcF family protein [Vibrio splendidus]NOJ07163.1 YdcF family protein [Vibrio splendidus]NOJ11366.1 YdcF family protein [Vibrio splendidus]